ncbi:MAG: DoxX family protein [Pyrinomonadaceae bacterium]
MAANNPPSRTVRWLSYVLSALPSLALLFSATAKLIKPAGIEQSLEPIGWKVGQLTGLGILEAAVVIVYLIPRTSVLGAILITGYLGGAIATHVRVGDHMIIPHIVLGVMVWLGLWLREPRLKSVLPLRS